MEADDIITDPKSYPGTTFYKTFSRYLTNTTDCGGHSVADSTNMERPDGCYSFKIFGEYTEGYKYLTNNTFIQDGLFNNGELMLPDGTLIFFDDSPEREGWKGTTIYVDINGYNTKPNRLGYDFFCFEVIDGTLYAMGDKGTTYEDDPADETCRKGFTCASRAKSQSDYFKTVVRKYK